MYNVFPALSGITWPVKKRPKWSTTKLLTASGNEFRTGNMIAPLSEFDLSYSYMSLADKATMEGFFNQQQGALIAFYFSADNDDTVTNQAFAVGDGTTKTFTLIKPAGTGATEPIGGVNGAPSIYDNGTLVGAANYSITGNQITFTTAPVSGHTLTWTGAYYYLVRFVQDVLDFTEFADKMYELQLCQLVTVR